MNQATKATPAELLDRAMTHLSTAMEDVQDAAHSLPNGSKAHQAQGQLTEVMYYLRLLMEGQRMAAQAADPIVPRYSEDDLARFTPAHLLSVARELVPDLVTRVHALGTAMPTWSSGPVLELLRQMGVTLAVLGNALPKVPEPGNRDAYQVEVDVSACDSCGAGKLWGIVGPGGVSHSTSYEDESDAHDMAASLNRAWSEGRAGAGGAVQLELTGQQVLDLARFVIPAWVTPVTFDDDDDAHQQLDVPVTVAVDPPTAPAGTWAWCSEYPDEGATRLGEAEPPRLSDAEYLRLNPEQPPLEGGKRYEDCGESPRRACGRPDCRYCATNVFE